MTIAFEIIEMVATLGMNGMRKARAEMKSTEKSANSLARALEAVDDIGNGFRKVEQGLTRIRDALHRTRVSASRPITLNVKLEGDREAVEETKQKATMLVQTLAT